MPLIGQEAAGSQNACWQAGSRSRQPRHLRSSRSEPRPCQSFALLPRFADIPWYLAQNGGPAMADLRFGVLVVESRRPECGLGMVGIVAVFCLVAGLSSTHAAQSRSKVTFCRVVAGKLIVACSCLAVGALLAAARLASSDKPAACSPSFRGISSSSTVAAAGAAAILAASAADCVCVTARQSNRPRTI
jgi:hypothetical protein